MSGNGGLFRSDLEPDGIHRRQEHQRHHGAGNGAADQRVGQRSQNTEWVSGMKASTAASEVRITGRAR